MTLAVFAEGTYEESRPYADWLGHRLPWWSARGSEVLAGRDFGFFACFLRTDDDRVFETYWSTDRGTEVVDWSYGLLDMTAYGRQESWQDSPPGWPTAARAFAWRVDGRPTVQWRVTDEPAGGSGCHGG